MATGNPTKEQILSGECFCTYLEMSPFLRRSVDTLKRWRREEKISPAIETGNETLFHFPSVVDALEKLKPKRREPPTNPNPKGQPRRRKEKVTA